MERDLDLDSNRIVKFLYSYGGKILPRRTDGMLRYVGGHIRVLSVDRSISYAELMVKFGELCGSSVILRCKLPKEDLDVLVTVTSDEELANVIEEYDRDDRTSSSCSKIRAVLSLPKGTKTTSPVSSPPKSFTTVSPISSTTSSVDSPDFRSINTVYSGRSSSPPKLAYGYPCPRTRSPSTTATARRCSNRVSPPIELPLYIRRDTAQLYYNTCHYPCHVGGSRRNY